MQTTIRIANPIAGGQSYTSAKRAVEFCKRGLAVVINDQLHFITASPAVIRQARMEEKRLKELMGVTFWNGAGKDPAAMHRPGEVRS